MIKTILFAVLMILFSGSTVAQSVTKTEGLFERTGQTSGRLNIVQNAEIDTLLNRYILMSIRSYEENGYYGMNGYRIQIYNSNNRNAREESRKAAAEFVSRFQDIVAYPMYQEPGYFKIRVGDFRTKAEATKPFLQISKVFPDAYIVPDLIRFPELYKN